MTNQHGSPLVSIIIPHHNQFRWLRQCLRSCLAQTHKPIEIIVVDDASSQDISPLTASFGTTVKLHRMPAQAGPGAARNIGLKLATGTLIQFLDCDDYIHEHKLAVQAAQMSAEQAPVGLSDWRRVEHLYGLNLPHPVRKLVPTADLLSETIADSEHWFPVMCGLFLKTFLEQVGPWREDLTWSEDREYRYRILKLNPKIARTSDCFFFYRRHITPSRATVPQLGRDGLITIARYDCSFVADVVADMRAGTVPMADARRGVLCRLAHLRRSASFCNDDDAAWIHSTVAQIEKQLNALNIKPDYSGFDLAPPRPTSTMTRWLKSFAKAWIPPSIWLRIVLMHNSLLRWISAWMGHWRARLSP